MKQLTYEINFSLKDVLSGKLLTINKYVKEVGESVKQTTSFTEKFAQINSKLTAQNFAAIASVVENTASALEQLSGTGGNFEQSMADLSSITGIAGKELQSLNSEARKLGKDSGLGAAGMAESYKLIASNIDVAVIGMEGLNNVQKESITLAQASGMTMAESAQSLSGTLNQFGLAAKESNRVINVLAAGSKYGAAEIPDLAQSFKVVGAAASAMGLNVEQTAGAIEVLSKANLKGSEAGTALRNIILKLNTELGYDLSKTSLSEALDDLRPKLSDATFLSKTFGMENIAAAQFLIGNANAVAEMTEKVTGTNVAQEQAAIRMDTSTERAKRMAASIEDLKISFFDLTGGASMYAGVIAQQAVIVAQMLPLLTMMKAGILAVATAENMKAVATTAATTATKLATAATAMFNAVMSANPIAMVVLAVGALVAALIAAYNNSEEFRKIVDACWDGVKRFAKVIWDNLVIAFEKVKSVITSVWNTLVDFFGGTKKAEEATTELAGAQGDLAVSTTGAASAADKQAEAEARAKAAMEAKLQTIGGLEEKIKELEKAQKTVSDAEALNIQSQINKYESLLNTKKRALAGVGMETPDKIKGGSFGISAPDATVVPLKFDYSGVKEAQKAIVSFNESIWGSESIIGDWADNAGRNVQKLTGIFKEYTKMLQDDTVTGVKKTAAEIHMMGAAMDTMSGMVGGAAGSWIAYGANVMSAISAAIPALMALMSTTVANTAVTAADTSANVANAASKAVAANAGLGPWGWVAGVAAVGGIVAAMMSIPKFADGGIISGPTVGLMGEYPGAANNPEVVAPLNKLKSLMQPTVFGDGEVIFRIEGDALVGIYNKRNNKNRRVR